MILNTPYCQVQAVRAAYRDRGIRTFPKPYWYAIEANFPDQTNSVPDGSTTYNTLQTDSDADFLWMSTWFTENAQPWNFDNNDVGNNGELGGGSKFSAKLVHISDASSQRWWSNKEFISPLAFDWTQGGVSGTQPQADSEITGSANPEGESIGVWRSWLLEPIIWTASSNIRVGVKLRPNSPFGVGLGFRGNLFVFSGVKLFRRD